MMERFNGIFRDREFAFRGLKKTDTPLIGGFMVYYNYTKNHIEFSELTPVEASKIRID